MELNRESSKEKIQMSKKHFKRHSVLLATREMQTKTFASPFHHDENRYHQQKPMTTNTDESVGKGNSWSTNWCGH